MARHLLIVFSDPADGQVEDYTRFFGSTHLPEMVASDGVASAQLFQVVSPEDASGLPGQYAAVYEVEGDIAVAKKAIQDDREKRTVLSQAVKGPRPFWLSAITEKSD